jgi:hypothetical protein
MNIHLKMKDEDRKVKQVLLQGGYQWEGAG